MERDESPPPENRLSRPKNWLPCRNSCSCAALTPGMGIEERTRKTASAPMTNSRRLRSPASVNNSAIFWTNVILLHGPSGFFYFCAGGRRYGATGYRKPLGKIAVPQNLYRGHRAPARAHKPALRKHIGADRIAVGEKSFQGIYVDRRRPVRYARCAIAAALGKFFQLFADIRADAVPSARFLPLYSASGSFTLAGSPAAP